MRTLMATAAAVLLLCLQPGQPVHAQSESSAALTGRVTSAEEGPLEGVLVGAKRSGSTTTVIVVTDAQGRYRFPRSRLQPGAHTLMIWAVGYELEPVIAEVAPRGSSTADLELRRTANLVAQLSNAEWLASIPGTPEQKASIYNCGHCHLLQRLMTTSYDADAWVPVLERMTGYPPLAFPLMPQRRPVDRVGPGAGNPAERQARYRTLGEYLASINLHSRSTWTYPLQAFPRPRGKATQVIYTMYDLAPPTRQPHDVIVDSDGMAWYASFGEQILAKLDPSTGAVTEYEVPLLKPGAPTGILAVRFDRDENLWLAMQFQGGIAKFDRKTERFQTWSLPPELNGGHVQITQLSPEHSHVDGKVWISDAGTYTVLRLDIPTGKFEVFTPFEIPRPNVYDVISDAQNNVYFTVMGREHVGRIDANTGEITLYQTPTAASAPRRGALDAAGRVWFGENRGNRIGMFEPRSGTFREWEAPMPYFFPYDVVMDKHGFVWAGGEYSDRILRLDPETSQFTEYALPGFVNVRRVFVDNRVTPAAFWVGANHTAAIIKLEPLDGALPLTSATAP